MKKYIPIIIAALAVSACGEPAKKTADQMDTEATKKVVAQASRAVGGLPAITNFYEKRLLKEIYERRDQADLTTYAYTQGLDGRLNCLGTAVGYGVPYSTQYSNPEKREWVRKHGYAKMPQAEPNGLFTPEGMSATWLQLVAPNGDIHVVYVEPTIVVSPFKITGAAVANGC